MSLTTPDGARPSLSLAPLPGLEPEELLFPVDPELVVADPPSLQDGLRAAALLWCTHSAWPTVRAIAACAGISASSVLWPYGTIDAMRHALMRAERVDLLAAHDPRLSRLPLIAALAAGVHDSDELTALAREVRALPAA